jgi:hypothetical protein
VLNADYRPLSTYPLSIIAAQDAVSAIWRERVDVVEAWPDAFFPLAIDHNRCAEGSSRFGIMLPFLESRNSVGARFCCATVSGVAIAASRSRRPI